MTDQKPIILFIMGDDIPPRQKPASLNLDRVMEKITVSKAA